MIERGERVHQKQLPIVLIVENDVLLRLVTASNLRELGFEVFEAADAAVAKHLLGKTVVVDSLADARELSGEAGVMEPTTFTAFGLRPSGSCPARRPSRRPSSSRPRDS